MVNIISHKRNANQSHNEVPLIATRMALSIHHHKKYKHCQGYEETGTLGTAGGDGKWCRHCGNSMGFLKELNKELPYGSAMSLLGIYPGLKLEKNRCLYVSVH